MIDKDDNPYASPEVPPQSAADETVRSMPRFVALAAGAVMAFVASLFAAVIAMVTGLDSWPLSNANLEYALGLGATWGACGALAVGLLALTVRPVWRSWVILVIASALWAGALGVYLFVCAAASAAA